jgi:4-alpha-glucanotransferase
VRPDAAPNRFPKPTRPERADLHRLARAFGVQTAYHSGLTGHTEASDESITLTLRSLGVALSGPSDAGEAMARAMDERARRRLEPVVIGWVGGKPTASMRLTTTRRGTPIASGRVRVELETEAGEALRHAVPVNELRVSRRREADGRVAWLATVPLTRAGAKLDAGYHTLTVSHAGDSFTAMLVIAPRVSYQTPEGAGGAGGVGGRGLGLFCPTYAIRSPKNLGIGNLTDLRRVGEWAADHGAPVLGTLPLLACFLKPDALHAASPYSPVSRLFFNELFIDPAEAPGLGSCAAAQRRMGSAAFKRRAAALRADRKLVDYRKSYRLIRPVLDDLAESFFAAGGKGSPEYQAFLAQNPQAERYAAFRAVCDRRGTPWDQWPERMQRGDLVARDYGRTDRQTHLYAQFALHEQLHGVARSLRARGGGLYLDLAVGAHPDGYDVWANPDLFMHGSSVGAPADPTYTRGQDWGFPPMHPERARQQGYRYFIDSLRTQMRVASTLRLDHVMALHRLFVVPAGHGASDGVYVQYREDELFAILSLESHRNRCRVFGENLGTVPHAIERAMTRHRVGKMWIGQFSMNTNPKRAVSPIEGNCVASLNTHDMPPVVACLEGSDVPTRVALDVFDAKNAPGELRGRKVVQRPVTKFLRTNRMMPAREKATPQAIGQGLNRYIASSEAELMLVNIEDLWGETHLQNVPGTSTQHPNWRPKLAKTLTGIMKDEDAAGQLEELARRRKARPKKR